MSGVAVFYVFNAIHSQTVMMNITKNMHEIIELMVQFLSGVSVFVAVIMGFLIIYATRFLIKRRNREFGLYMLLGMSKRQISMILFGEDIPDRADLFGNRTFDRCLSVTVYEHFSLSPV